MNTVTLGWPFAVLVVALTGAAAAATRLAGLGTARHVVIAATRAYVEETRSGLFPDASHEYKAQGESRTVKHRAG